jgi:hypothetical protein
MAALDLKIESIFAAAAVGAFVVFIDAPALANDSSAELATGGLVFVRNPNVQMRSEQLYVSSAQIHVTYHFVNNSDQPITNLVAFPMPDITIENPGTNIAIPTEAPENFLAFTTTVDGQNVVAQVEQKAIANGIDQTALLQQLGIPLAPQLQQTADDALTALPQDKWQQLITLGLAETEAADVGGNRQYLVARWTLKTTYYWQQTFPAHRELVIQHQYKPSVGVSLGSGVGNTQYAAPPDYQAKYCMDSGFIAAARAQQAITGASRLLGEKRIDYVLTTGANWAGPIADFTLTVDKGDAANLVSFCGDGVKKISPTQFQVHYTDFTPKTDLAVLILTRDTVTP